jgi:hypothetical protein
MDKYKACLIRNFLLQAWGTKNSFNNLANSFVLVIYSERRDIMNPNKRQKWLYTRVCTVQINEYPAHFTHTRTRARAYIRTYVHTHTYIHTHTHTHTHTYIHTHTHTHTESGSDPGFVGPEAYKILGAPL